MNLKTVCITVIVFMEAAFLPWSHAEEYAADVLAGGVLETVQSKDMLELSKQMAPYNAVFLSASQDETGSIPIGNGNVGINLWVEEDGDLLFYVSRNDAWAEAMTLCWISGNSRSSRPYSHNLTERL